MHLKKLPKEHPHNYTLTFFEDEVTTVGAARREKIYYLKSKNNPGAITEFDIVVASWEENKDVRYEKNRPYRRAVDIHSATAFAQELQDFYDQTNVAIGEIPEQTGIPAFSNKDMVTRVKLGRSALALAKEIRKKLNPDYDFDALEAQLEEIEES